MKKYTIHFVFCLRIGSAARPCRRGTAVNWIITGVINPLIWPRQSRPSRFGHKIVFTTFQKYFFTTSKKQMEGHFWNDFFCYVFKLIQVITEWSFPSDHPPSVSQESFWSPWLQNDAKIKKKSKKPIFNSPNRQKKMKDLAPQSLPPICNLCTSS